MSTPFFIRRLLSSKEKSFKLVFILCSMALERSSSTHSISSLRNVFLQVAEDTLPYKILPKLNCFAILTVALQTTRLTCLRTNLFQLGFEASQNLIPHFTHLVDSLVFITGISKLVIVYNIHCKLPSHNFTHKRQAYMCLSKHHGLMQTVVDSCWQPHTNVSLLCFARIHRHLCFIIVTQTNLIENIYLS